ncbi:MAG: hypothetical protein AAF571_05265 [Verrucomicrobiota bacterium]
MNQPRVILLTDIPEWCQPWAAALSNAGFDVQIADDSETVSSSGVLFNRISADAMQHQPAWVAEVESYLEEQEKCGRDIIHGFKVMRLGYDKQAQTEHFRQCKVATPDTSAVASVQRAFPDQEVLLKPAIGAYGDGISSLESGEDIPQSVVNSTRAILEQVKIKPLDGCVHRAEWIGDRLVYDAATPISDGKTNYCLSNTSDSTVLKSDLPEQRVAEVTRIMEQAGMHVGSVEYLLLPDGRASYIDLNPVSTFHPQTQEQIGMDPYAYFAQWLSGTV